MSFMGLNDKELKNYRNKENKKLKKFGKIVILESRSHMHKLDKWV